MNKKVAFLLSSPMMLNFVYPHINRLDDLGYEVTVLSDFENGGADFRHKLNRSVLISSVPIKRKISTLEILTVGRFYRIAKEIGVLVTLGPKSLLYGFICGCFSFGSIRLVHIITGQFWAASSEGLKRLFIKTEKMCLSVYKLAITDSPAQLGYLKCLKYPNILKTVSPGSIRGVDSEFFDPKIVEPEIINEENLVVGFVGRITEDKGVQYLIKAIDTLNSQGSRFSLLLVGPIESKALAEKIEERDDIQHVGFVSDVRPYLRSMDIFCLPSLREGFGMSVIEASSMALPVIVSDIYGLEDSIVDGVTGLRFRSGDVTDLIAKLVALESRETRKRLGEAGRARVGSCFKEWDVVEQYINLIQESVDD